MSVKFRIGIVNYYSCLNTIPSVCAAIEHLVEHGYFVDVFTRVDSHFEFPTFISDRVQVFASRTAGSKIREHKIGRLWHSNILRAFVHPFSSILRKTFSDNAMPQKRLLRRRHEQIPYKAVIGIDPKGLDTAGLISKLLDIPMIYWSLELLLTNELTGKNWTVLKEREISLSRIAFSIVIQDEERAKLLSSDNDIPMNKFLYIPNSSRGPVQKNSSGYWHRHFGLQRDLRIVLHPGSFGDWTGIKEIISSVNNWPEDWVLIVHARDRADENPKFKELQTIANPDRVYFSTQPVSRDKFPQLIAGADIGVAFYLPGPPPYTLENIHTIGLSSGKIASYLKAGLPVIVNKWPSISKLIENEMCGIAVDEAVQIGNSIELIAQSYKEYKRNAYKTFEKYIDPSSHLKEFIRQIDNI